MLICQHQTRVAIQMLDVCHLKTHFKRFSSFCVVVVVSGEGEAWWDGRRISTQKQDTEIKTQESHLLSVAVIKHSASQGRRRAGRRSRWIIAPLSCAPRAARRTC